VGRAPAPAELPPQGPVRPGFVESAGDTTERGGPRGGPRAALYRAGDARLLHPPMLRSATEERIR
jgi:8-oxo-dGTP diphosphatase